MAQLHSTRNLHSSVLYKYRGRTKSIILQNGRPPAGPCTDSFGLERFVEPECRVCCSPSLLCSALLYSATLLQCRLLRNSAKIDCSVKLSEHYSVLTILYFTLLVFCRVAQSGASVALLQTVPPDPLRFRRAGPRPARLL